jgi:hypothetical protein
LYNVSGKSIRCFVSTSELDKEYTDPVDRNGMKPTECRDFALDDAASVVRMNLGAFSSALRMPDILHGSDLKIVCRKIDLSGKKF